MRKISILLLVFVFATLNGCGSDSSTSLGGQESPTIPAEVQRLMDRYAIPVEIPTTDDNVVLERNSIDPPDGGNYDVYAVTFLWGSLLNLANNNNASIVTDFSGMATINGVAIIDVTHTIDFEANQDEIIPTNVPSNLAWTSFVTNDYDGFNCLIYLDKDIVYITAPQLTFNTTPFTHTFSFEDLAHLDAYFPISNTMGVAVHARKIYSSACPSGVILGEWIRADIGGSSGTIQGSWWEQNSEPFGIMAGTFWTEPNGTRKFEAWVSEGVMAVTTYWVRGTWYYDDPRLCPICGTGHGWFSGYYTDMDGNLRGIVKSEFGNLSLDPANNSLPMNGSWRQFCCEVNYRTQLWFE